MADFIAYGFQTPQGQQTLHSPWRWEKLASVNGQKDPWEYQSWSRSKRKALGLSTCWEKSFNVIVFQLNSVFRALRVTKS